MKTRSTFLTTILALALLAACKKEKAKQDCEINNYGTIKVKFLYPSDQYSVEVNNRIKSLSAGISSDTLNIVPGPFVLEIYNKSKGDVTAQGINIETCKEIAVNSTN